MGIIFGGRKAPPASGTNASHIQNDNPQQGQRVLSTRQIKAKQGNELSEKDKVLIQLKQVKDQLNKRMAQIEQGINQSEDLAKQYLRQNQKNRAMFALERKQLYQQYETNILNQDKTISKTIIDAQEAYDLLQATNTLKMANKLITDINKAIDIDAMKDAADNLNELQQNNDKFSELYEEYVGVHSDQIMDQVNQMEIELLGNQNNNSNLIQQTTDSVTSNKNQQNQVNLINPPLSNEKQNQQQKVEEEDDLDRQLAMLA